MTENYLLGIINSRFKIQNLIEWWILLIIFWSNLLANLKTNRGNRLLFGYDQFPYSLKNNLLHAHELAPLGWASKK